MAISDYLRVVHDRVAVVEEPDPAGTAPDTPDNPADTPDNPEPPDALPADPAPARTAKTGTGRRRRAAAPPVKKTTVAERKQVSDALSMMIEIPAGIWAIRDPRCGGAMSRQIDEIIAKLTPIVLRNPKMLAWFTDGVGYMDWLGLAVAFWPVGKEVWSHHVVKSGPHAEGVTGPDGSRPDFSHYTAPDLA